MYKSWDNQNIDQKSNKCIVAYYSRHSKKTNKKNELLPYAMT